MAQELEKMAGDLLKGDRAEALKQNAKEIRKLAQSTDGKKVRSLMGDEQKVAEALEKGDTETLKKLMTQVLSTEEGSRLAQQLMGLMR